MKELRNAIVGRVRKENEIFIWLFVYFFINLLINYLFIYFLRSICAISQNHNPQGYVRGFRNT